MFLDTGQPSGFIKGGVSGAIVPVLNVFVKEIICTINLWSQIVLYQLYKGLKKKAPKVSLIALTPLIF